MYLVFEHSGDYPLVLSVKRRPGETEAAAMAKRDELADHLRASFPHFEVNVAPHSTFRVKQSPDISVTPPLMSFVGAEQLVKVLCAQTVDERAAIVAELEDAVSEHFAQVDTLNMVSWCLRPLKLRLPYRYTSNRFADDLLPLQDELERVRLELLQPFLRGKYPIKMADVFSAFWALPTRAREAIDNADSYQSPVTANAFSSDFRTPDGKTDMPALQAWWRATAQELVAAGWLVPFRGDVTSYNKHALDPAYGPALSKGPKSRLVKPRMMRL